MVENNFICHRLAEKVIVLSWVYFKLKPQTVASFNCYSSLWFLWCQPTIFKDGRSALRLTAFIRWKPFWLIDLRNWFSTTDSLDNSGKVWRHAWQPFENFDLTRLFKSDTNFQVSVSILWQLAKLYQRSVFYVHFPFFLY